MTKADAIEELVLIFYRKIDKYQRLFPNGIDKLVDTNGIKVWINRLDKGGRRYMIHHAEVVNKFYKLVADEYNPTTILDIGANYGFISAIMHKYMPDARTIAIEPNKKLIPYLKRNFEMHGLNGTILNCMCGFEPSSEHDFFINPRSSMDSRVVGKEKWKKQPVASVSIDSLLKEHPDPVFIKIDTQGYEEFILRGGENFLSSNNKWIIKMEFCPCLLEHHGTNTKNFLLGLIDKYEVAEIADVPFNTKSLNSIFDYKLNQNDADGFIKYIRMLKEDEIGWGDVLVRPKLLQK
jgi:FkbM family methyltransferase